MLGGQLDVYADTFERHSYEAELAAFQDHLAATRDSVTVLVTDCLSGMQAGHAFSGRTISSKAARYRDKELGNIFELEQRHRAILYVHIHSHDGITPNEAADATKMQPPNLCSTLRYCLWTFCPRLTPSAASPASRGASVVPPSTFAPLS